MNICRHTKVNFLYLGHWVANNKFCVGRHFVKGFIEICTAITIKPKGSLNTTADDVSAIQF